MADLAGEQDPLPERAGVVAVGARRPRRCAVAVVDGHESSSLASRSLRCLSEREHAVEHDRADDEHADHRALPEVLDAEDRAARG